MRAREALILYYHHTERTFPVIPPFHPLLTSFCSHLSTWRATVKMLVPSECQSSFQPLGPSPAFPPSPELLPATISFSLSTAVSPQELSSRSQGSRSGPSVTPGAADLPRAPLADTPLAVPRYSSVYLILHLIFWLLPVVLSSRFRPGCLSVGQMNQPILSGFHRVCTQRNLPIVEEETSSSLRILRSFPSLTVVLKWLQYTVNFRRCGNSWGSLSPSFSPAQSKEHKLWS